VRLLSLLFGMVIGIGAAAAAERETSVTMSTPASVQLTSWCGYGDKGCAQNAADVAQASCQKYKRDAELDHSDLIQRDLAGREKFGFRFKCVK
jgi:hypothetical protein